ncbi:MAG: phosphoribosylformylglycinamidine synthase subunit PurQ [Candidatus Omnitrophota bacterium]
MKKNKALILRTAGTNCDKETEFAFNSVGAEAQLVHVKALIKDKSMLEEYHILAIPGGFTYGDDIASGKILANELKFGLGGELSRFISQGKIIIGICNGFQVLVKMGLLPNLTANAAPQIEATLSLNDSGRFDDRWVYLRNVKCKIKNVKIEDAECKIENVGMEGVKCIWAKGLPDVIYLPIAHAEGKFIPKDKNVLESLQKNNQIVFRYSDRSGKVGAGYPHNPNGSVDDIAGICDTTGRVFGMMPHPERHITYLQHPNWRRVGLGDRKKMGIGLKIFENGVNFVRGH